MHASLHDTYIDRPPPGTSPTSGLAALSRAFVRCVSARRDGGAELGLCAGQPASWGPLPPRGMGEGGYQHSLAGCNESAREWVAAMSLIVALAASVQVRTCVALACQSFCLSSRALQASRPGLLAARQRESESPGQRASQPPPRPLPTGGWTSSPLPPASEPAACASPAQRCCSQW
jgi:hypothetical protein